MKKIEKLKSFDKFMRKIGNINQGSNEDMVRAYDRIIVKKISMIIFFVSQVCFSQVHMNFGVVHISDRTNEQSISYSVGHTENISSKIGIKGSFRASSAYAVNYMSGDLQMNYRIIDNIYRLDISSGGSWNDVNKQINPMIGIKNYVEIDPSLFITAEIENVFSEKNLTYISLGIALDATWSKKKTHRFF